MAENDLLETLKSLRDQEFPELPEELIVKAVAIETAHPENRLEAQRLLEDLLIEYVKAQASE